MSGAQIAISDDGNETRERSSSSGAGLLYTTSQMMSKGFGFPSGIMTFFNDAAAGAVSLEERFWNLFEGGTNGDFNPELYTNGGAAKFLEMASNTAGYQQEVGDLAVLRDNEEDIKSLLKGEKVVSFVGPGSFDKEAILLRWAPDVEMVNIYELSPEFNEHSYWRVQEIVKDLQDKKVIKHSVDVRAYNGDFRALPMRPSHGVGTVICIGGLTNPENVPKEQFPSGHYANFLKSLKLIAKPASNMPGKGQVVMSFTTAKEEKQMRGIYDNPAFHRWILHPLIRLKKGGNVDGLEPDAFRYAGIHYAESGLFAHHIEATKDQTLRLHFIDSVTGRERTEVVNIFKGSRYNILTSTGMDTDKLSKIAMDSAGMSTKKIFAAKDPDIYQKMQVFVG